MVSFGLIMVDDEERVNIISHVGSTPSPPSLGGETRQEFRDVLTIPRKSVVSVDVLGELFEVIKGDKASM